MNIFMIAMLILLGVAIVALVFGFVVYGSMYEDQLIICVSGHVVDKDEDEEGLICHLYTDLNQTEYKKTLDNGSFFNLDDSFDMKVIK